MEIRYEVLNDNILSLELQSRISRRMYRSIKANNIDIYVNGIKTFLYMKIKKGDIISFDYDIKKEISWPLYEAMLDIKYLDDNYLVLNKRKNLLTIPTKSNPTSVYQEVLYYLKKEKDFEGTVSIINRLDYQTSGLMLIALNKPAANKQKDINHIKRKYEALVEGIIEEDSGIVNIGIKKDDNSNKRIASPNGINAITHYNVLKRYSDKTLVQFELETGRTHQIRVHSAYMNHPIVGDALYGNNINSDLYLTSTYIEFENYENKKIKISINNWWNNEER